MVSAVIKNIILSIFMLIRYWYFTGEINKFYKNCSVLTGFNAVIDFYKN